MHLLRRLIKVLNVHVGIFNGLEYLSGTDGGTHYGIYGHYNFPDLGDVWLE